MFEVIDGYRVGVPLLNRMHSLTLTRSRYSNRAVKKSIREINCVSNNIINNHLPPASVCAELGDGKQAI